MTRRTTERKNPKTDRPRLRAIEVVGDRTAESRCDEGFLRVERLSLVNEYEDGTRSAEYACDVVSRRGIDAVVAVLFAVEEPEDGERAVRVLLRDGPRPPIYLRHRKQLVHPDPREYRSLVELVAGIVEDSDGGGGPGLARRASVESEEEAGIAVAPSAFRTLGGESFASPGTSDEKLYFCAAEAPLDAARGGEGDGSAMEENARVVCLELSEAIAACRSGAIPDLKTEVGLLRLADAIGYLPQLGCFVDELPEALRERRVHLGVDALPSARDGETRNEGAG